MKKLSLIMLMACLSLLFAETVSYQEVISAPSVSRSGKLLEGTNDQTATVGKPELPMKAYRFVLPYANKLDEIVVKFTDEKILSGRYDIQPVGEPAIIGQPVSLPEKNDPVWKKNENYPEKNYELVTVQRKNGIDIAYINVFPYKFNPVSRKLSYFENISVELETSYDSKIKDAQDRKILKSDKVIESLERLTVNAELADSYPAQNIYSPSSRLVDLNDPSEMIIITNEDFVEFFQGYEEWKEEHNIQTAIYTVEDIYASFSNGDNATKVRDFIIEAYEAWGSSDHPLEYVILGGDDEICPVRHCWGYVNEEGSIPTEEYFGNLDGNWNADGDNVFGEQNDGVDFVPEVSIGRFTGDNLQDFQNMFKKIKSYTDYPYSYLDNATMVGEQLNDSPIVWGKTHKEQISESPLYLPTYYRVTGLYQEDGTFTTQNLIDHINNIDAGNQPPGIMNHMGHCNWNLLMTLSPNDIDNLTNTSYPFLYSQGCYPLAFDQQESGNTESVGEHILFAEGGTMGFVGNTRYGWYSYNAQGSSQHFDKRYFYGLFTEEIRAIGKCNDYTKEVLANYVNQPTFRWSHFELMTAGDPSIEIINGEGNLSDVSLAYANVSEHNGDDGVINPGEQVEIGVTLMTNGDYAPMNGTIATIMPVNEFASVFGEASREIGDINSGDFADNNDDPFIIQLADDCPVGEVELAIIVEANIGTTGYIKKKLFTSVISSANYQNFPYENDGIGISSNVVAVDLDNNGILETVTADLDGNVLAVNAETGELIPGFPVNIGGSVTPSIAVGNIDDDPELEIVAVTSGPCTVTAVNHDGSTVFTKSDFIVLLGNPAIYDITGDGKGEVIIGGFSKNLYAVKGNGEDVPGFPVLLSEKVYAAAGIGDIDGDNENEIVVGTFDGKLQSVEFDGSLTPGYPIDLGGQINTSPVFAEGKVVVGGSSPNKLYITANGTVESTIDLPQKLSESASAANLNDDPEKEIVFCAKNGMLYVVDANGSNLPGWPKDLGNSVVGSPIIADLDNNGSNDIIMMDNVGTVHAFDAEGNYLQLFPLVTGTSTNSNLTVSDIDNNGTAELISGNNIGISVLDLKYECGDLTAWPTFRSSVTRTGNYDSSVDKEENEINPFETALISNYPNPFNPNTTIKFNLSESDARHPVSVTVYNVKGQVVKVFAKDKGNVGINFINWNGVNDQNETVTSGVYFYKLNTNSKTQVNKMLLMK
ncbi:MAG: hypothetical protein CSB55_00570 [Candidatus Cloacimonadota bacterium]|nr:MAG: hypothetical protein CSB55_00570 [Candidatus Cloacimonadota bacterium]